MPVIISVYKAPSSTGHVTVGGFCTCKSSETVINTMQYTAIRCHLSMLILWAAGRIKVTLKYRIEGNFGGEKLWRIAQIRQSLIRQLVTILSRAEPVARWKKMSILNYFKLKPGSKVKFLQQLRLLKLLSSLPLRVDRVNSQVRVYIPVLLQHMDCSI